jgi:hypothetical protein
MPAGVEVTTADASRWQEPGDSRLPRADHQGEPRGGVVVEKAEL